MRRKLITLLLITSFSLYCTFYGEKTSSNPEQNVQESYFQENDASIDPIVQTPDLQKNDACRKFSKENLSMTKENTIEVWLAGVAQQVLALAVWCGLKQTLKIIFLKRNRIARW